MITMGIDVGGTFTRVAVVKDVDQVVVSQRRKTETVNTCDDFLFRLVESVSQIRAEAAKRDGKVDTVGLALPGVLDGQRGVLLRSINLPFLQHYPLPVALAQQTGLTVRVMTDAEAATWGEYAARPRRLDRFGHLRLGTGVACGVILDGVLEKLERSLPPHSDRQNAEGAFHRETPRELAPTTAYSRKTDPALHQGRLVHPAALVVNEGEDATRCRCGLTGCLETVASGTAIRDFASAIGCAEMEELQIRSASGESHAGVILKRVARAVHRAMIQVADRYRLRVMVLGGGVTQGWPALYEAVKARMDVGSGRASLEDNVRVEQATLGDEAGVIGAALAVREPQAFVHLDCPT